MVRPAPQRTSTKGRVPTRRGTAWPERCRHRRPSRHPDCTETKPGQSTRCVAGWWYSFRQKVRNTRKGTRPLLLGQAALTGVRAVIQFVCFVIAFGRGNVMTIAISLKTPEGVVLGADSTTTCFVQPGQVGQLYNSAQKIYEIGPVWHHFVAGECFSGAIVTYDAGSLGPVSWRAAISNFYRERIKPAPRKRCGPPVSRISARVLGRIATIRPGWGD